MQSRGHAVLGPTVRTSPGKLVLGPTDVVLRIRYDMVMGRASLKDKCISACKLRTSTDTQGYALLKYDSIILRIIGSQGNEGIIREY